MEVGEGKVGIIGGETTREAEVVSGGEGQEVADQEGGDLFLFHLLGLAGTFLFPLLWVVHHLQ